MNSLPALIGLDGFKLYGLVTEGAYWESLLGNILQDVSHQDFWHRVASDEDHQIAQKTDAQSGARRRDV